MGAFIERMKGKKGTVLLLLGLVAGLLLLAVGSFDLSSEKTVNTPNAKEELAEVNDYVKELEFRIEELLEHMDGVSEVNILLIPEAGTEVIYAQNGKYDGGYLSEKEYVLTDADGDEEPIRLKLVYPKLRGASVVCRGGSNPILQEKIVALLSSLLDLPTNRVYVTG